MLLPGKSGRMEASLAFDGFPCPRLGEHNNGRGFARAWRPAGNRLRGHQRDDARQQANGCASAHGDSMAGGKQKYKTPGCFYLQAANDMGNLRAGVGKPTH